MKSKSASLWIAVGIAFAVLLASWAVLFSIASRNRVAEVPLSHKNPPAPAAPADAP